MAKSKVDPVKALRLDLLRLQEKFEGLLTSEQNRRDQVNNLDKSVARLQQMVVESRSNGPEKRIHIQEN